MPSSQNEGEVQVALSLKWPKPDIPQKSKVILQKLLQSWFNRHKVEADCSVIRVSGDGSPVIRIKPIPGAV